MYWINVSIMSYSLSVKSGSVCVVVLSIPLCYGSNYHTLIVPYTLCNYAVIEINQQQCNIVSSTICWNMVLYYYYDYESEAFITLKKLKCTLTVQPDSKTTLCLIWSSSSWFDLCKSFHMLENHAFATLWSQFVKALFVWTWHGRSQSMMQG